MALNIKSQDVEELARQLAAATGVTKTEAIRQALLEKRDRLGLKSSQLAMQEMEQVLRAAHAGRTFEPVSKAEWDSLYE